MASRLSLEHSVLRGLPKASRREKWLLAVSGGADSLVMAEILFRWQRYLNLELAVAHVHHGPTPDPSQRKFRSLARALVKKWADKKSLTFYTNATGKSRMKSESEYRRFRLDCLEQWRVDGAFDRIVFAHHADDLLETRLLRLIRGTGAQGLKSMAVRRGRAVRPLLHASRAEILAFAKAEKIDFIDDPSNARGEESLRNWLRNEWLPRLESHRPGSLKSLARSLGHLASDEFTETIGPFVGLRREALVHAAPQLRAAIVARYFRSLGVKNYSRDHVQEVLKRLGTRRKPVPFAMFGFSFETTPDFLWASRTSRV